MLPQPARRPSRTRRDADRRGAAVVETALVLPVFLMVMLGIIEIGRYFMVSQMVANAAREGARVAIVTGSTNADVTATVKDITQRTTGVDQSDVQVTVTVVEYTGNPGTNNDVSLAQKRDLCCVAVAIDYDKVNLLPVKWLTGVQVNATACMRHE